MPMKKEIEISYQYQGADLTALVTYEDPIYDVQIGNSFVRFRRDENSEFAYIAMPNNPIIIVHVHLNAIKLRLEELYKNGLLP